ncbi:MAG: DegT/DnrJ/EryC1/StrS family aminotransferase, partial [Rubrivivax sp.]|nr:DegT/DnrJ/EryC1/StrS family aminotransferase [Rubrivivax sp.]
GLVDAGRLQLLAQRADRDSVWAQYTVRLPAAAGVSRDAVQQALRDAGVPSAVHYPTPLHHQPAYADLCCPDCCPESLAASGEVLSLPMSADLAPADQDRVVAALAAALRSTGGAR